MFMCTHKYRGASIGRLVQCLHEHQLTRLILNLNSVHNMQHVVKVTINCFVACGMRTSANCLRKQ